MEIAVPYFAAIREQHYGNERCASRHSGRSLSAEVGLGHGRLHPWADYALERHRDEPQEQQHGSRRRDPFDERADAEPVLAHAAKSTPVAPANKAGPCTQKPGF